MHSIFPAGQLGKMKQFKNEYNADVSSSAPGCGAYVLSKVITQH